MKLKDNRVTITKIDPNYKEIRKLDALLTEAGIPHTFQTLYWNKTGDLRGAQIIYPEDGPNRVADVIITGASYGNEFDLLEMKGLVSETAEPDELTTGNIEGYMTAERCFRRIRYHWDTHGGKEATGNAYVCGPDRLQLPRRPGKQTHPLPVPGRSGQIQCRQPPGSRPHQPGNRANQELYHEPQNLYVQHPDAAHRPHLESQGGRRCRKAFFCALPALRKVHRTKAAAAWPTPGRSLPLP